jgi:hypothetical protein
VRSRTNLAVLDAAAQAYVAGQRPPNTLIAYAGDWKLWEDFTHDAGIPLLSASLDISTRDLEAAGYD